MNNFDLDMMTEALAQLRESDPKIWTMRQIAQELQISESTARRILSGHSIPDAFLLCRIADLLSINVWVFFTANQAAPTPTEEEIREIIAQAQQNLTPFPGFE